MSDWRTWEGGEKGDCISLCLLYSRVSIKYSALLSQFLHGILVIPCHYCVTSLNRGLATSHGPWISLRLMMFLNRGYFLYFCSHIRPSGQPMPTPPPTTPPQTAPASQFPRPIHATQATPERNKITVSV